jgi:hypothetical protein
MRSFFRNNGLSLFVLGLFAVFWVGQLVTGWSVYNEEREDNGKGAVSFGSYVTSAHALEATAENWESEFLQMGAFALFTGFLIQRGSAESKDPEKNESSKTRKKLSPDAPWPVKRGGWILKIYEHSLSLVLFALFLGSFALHARGGAGVFNEEQLRHGEPAISVWRYVGTPQFWFESFQNWQSEFLSMAAMVLLSIFLREKGSPESKPVETPHHAYE